MDSEDRGRGGYTFGSCYQQHQIIQGSSHPRENCLEEKGESRTSELRGQGRMNSQPRCRCFCPNWKQKGWLVPSVTTTELPNWRGRGKSTHPSWASLVWEAYLFFLLSLVWRPWRHQTQSFSSPISGSGCFSPTQDSKTPCSLPQTWMSTLIERNGQCRLQERHIVCTSVT